MRRGFDCPHCMGGLPCPFRITARCCGLSASRNPRLVDIFSQDTLGERDVMPTGRRKLGQSPVRRCVLMGIPGGQTTLSGGVIRLSQFARLAQKNRLKSTGGRSGGGLSRQRLAVDESPTNPSRIGCDERSEPRVFAAFSGSDCAPHRGPGTQTMSIEAIQAAIFLLFLGVSFLAGTITVRQNR